MSSMKKIAHPSAVDGRWSARAGATRPRCPRARRRPSRLQRRPPCRRRKWRPWRQVSAQPSGDARRAVSGMSAGCRAQLATASGTSSASNARSASGRCSRDGTAGRSCQRMARASWSVPSGRWLSTMAWRRARGGPATLRRRWRNQRTPRPPARRRPDGRHAARSGGAGSHAPPPVRRHERASRTFEAMVPSWRCRMRGAKARHLASDRDIFQGARLRR